MQKKICTLCIVLMVLCVTSLKAQLFVGIEAGANRNYLISNTSDKPFFQYQPSYGFSAGIPVRYVFSSKWISAVQAVPSYVQKNYRIQRTQDYSDIYQQTNNGYIELPLMVQFRLGGGQLKKSKPTTVNGFLNLGGYAGYWLHGHVTGRTSSPMDLVNSVAYDEAYSFDNRKDNRFEWGGLLGLGLQFVPNKKYVYSIEARYTPSFSDQQKKYQQAQTPRYNDTYSLILGVQCNWKMIKHSSKGIFK